MNKNSIRKKYPSAYLLFALSIFNIYHTQTSAMATPQLPAAPTMNAPVSAYDTIIDEAQKMLHKTCGVLTDLSTMINNKQIKLKSPKESLYNIQACVNLIQQITQEKFAHATPQTAALLLQLNQEIVKHIEKCIKNDFKEFTPFDATVLITRNGEKQSIDLSTLQKTVQTNKKRVEKLVQNADSAGLTWYNKTYRKLDTYIIDPSIKYSIPQRSLAAGAAASFAGYFWWKFRSETNDNPNANTWYNTIVGPKPTVNPLTGGYGNFDQLGWLGRAEYAINEISGTKAIIGAGLLYLAKDRMMNEWNTYYPIAKNKIEMWHNRLKGGAYLNKANKLDSNNLDDVSFDDMIGLDEVKENFQLFVDYLKNPEPFDRIGITPQKGCLLVGDSRTGKTFSVKALANEVKKMLTANKLNDKFRYQEFNASDINMFGIQKILDFMKNNAPCIIFIDEIDLLDLQRKGQNKMLSEFLIGLSGTVSNEDPKSQVFVIAATNRPESLDIALRKPGRFGLEMRFELPVFAHRRQLLARKLNKLSLNLANFDIDKLARETEGQSYEALNMLINQALLKARIKGEILSQQHLEDSLNSSIRHIIKEKDRRIPKHEEMLLATHFAGHTLGIKLLDMRAELSTVTLYPIMTEIKEQVIGHHLYGELYGKKNTEQKRREYGHLFMSSPNDSIEMLTRDEKIKMCKYYLAGIAAEEILLGAASHSCHAQDSDDALDIAKSLTFEGMTPENLPKELQKERYVKALDLVAQCKKEVSALLAAHKDQLIAIRQELLDKKTLNNRDVDTIMNPTSSSTDQLDADIAQDTAVSAA